MKSSAKAGLFHFSESFEHLSATTKLPSFRAGLWLPAVPGQRSWACCPLFSSSFLKTQIVTRSVTNSLERGSGFMPTHSADLWSVTNVIKRSLWYIEVRRPANTLQGNLHACVSCWLGSLFLRNIPKKQGME